MYSSGENNSIRPINITVGASGILSPTSSSLSSSSRERAGLQLQPQQQQQMQWGEEETKKLIGIRGDLEKDFTVTKRNKALWEIVSLKMREKGFFRTPDQCKCKWKNLINRYKGKETSDPDNALHCPFFEELHAVFTERAMSMQRLLLESEAGSTQPKKTVKRAGVERSFDDFSEDEDEDGDGNGEERLPKSNPRKRKVEKIAAETSSRVASSSNTDIVGIQELLKEFFQQQQQMEMQWSQMMERRAHEQQEFEQEWRQKMQKIERERLIAEQAWREREEQRRIREEKRAERRDALLTILLNKLLHENDMQ